MLPFFAGVVAGISAVALARDRAGAVAPRARRDPARPRGRDPAAPRCRPRARSARRAGRRRERPTRLRRRRAPGAPPARLRRRRQRRRGRAATADRSRTALYASDTNACQDGEAPVSAVRSRTAGAPGTHCVADGRDAAAPAAARAEALHLDAQHELVAGTDDPTEPDVLDPAEQRERAGVARRRRGSRSPPACASASSWSTPGNDRVAREVAGEERLVAR